MMRNTGVLVISIETERKKPLNITMTRERDNEGKEIAQTHVMDKKGKYPIHMIDRKEKRTFRIRHSDEQTEKTCIETIERT
jgi:hypothetical protein